MKWPKSSAAIDPAGLDQRFLYRFLRSFAILGLLGAIGAPPALADPTGIFGNTVRGANVAIKNAMRKAQPAGVPGTTVGQVPPLAQQPVNAAQQIGLPTGFTYTLDVSAAYPLGNIGSKNKWLPGGMDAVAGYGFNSTTRFVANYYQLQHYPAGFNSGSVPFYLQGLPNASSADLSSLQPQIDVTTKDKFTLLMLEKLFIINIRGTKIPLVITPTYVARTSTVAASNGNGDVVPFEHDGFPVYGIHTRTAQIKSLAFTLPFLKTPKMFGTFTVAPSWLMHTAGLNQDNHAQLYQILYLEYNPTDTTKIFFEPQSSRDYLPADPYPQHLVAYFLGVSQMLTKNSFVQIILNSGNPTNYKPYGVSALYCQQAGNCANTTIPGIGGLKATQYQIQFGIGSPSVLQF